MQFGEIKMITLTNPQLKVLSTFFGNMAVLWFAAGFIGQTNIVLGIQYFLSGALSLSFALRIAKVGEWK